MLKKINFGNLIIPIIVIAIAVFGIVMIYSASNYSALADFNDKYFFAKKQLIGFVFGICAMLGTSLLPYQKIKKLKWHILIISIILLTIVFIPGIGIENYGAKRWIGIGPITLQPSEIAKFGFVIFSASYIADNTQKMHTIIGALPILLVGVVISVLIILEPNMSITMCVCLLMLGLLFIGGLKFRFFIMLLIPFLVAAVGLILIEPYRLNRLSAFLNPWASPKGEGYQLIQSLYALGSGGWFGVGLFNSRQKFEFLPFAESDFILSVIGEEIGFIGIAVFFLAMLLLIFAGFKTMSKCSNAFGYVLAGGITLVYAIQVIINILVVTGSIPPTGLPLPLVSAGNTSLIVFMAAFGVLYNISKQNN